MTGIAENAGSAALRIAVLLSGEGTSLENLCERIDEGSVPARVVAVLSSKPEAGGLARAPARHPGAFSRAQSVRRRPFVQRRHPRGARAFRDRPRGVPWLPLSLRAARPLRGARDQHPPRTHPGLLRQGV